MEQFSPCKDVNRTADSEKLSSHNGKRRKGDVTTGSVADPEESAECLPELALPPHSRPEESSVRKRQAQQLEIPGINGKLMRLHAETVGFLQSSVPNIADVCRIGANRSEVRDVDRPDGRVKTWRRQVVLEHSRQGRSDTSDSTQDALAEGKSTNPLHRHNTELREDGCRVVDWHPFRRRDPGLVLFHHR